MTTHARARLYHGTRRGFTKGGLLLPRSTHGGPGTAAPINPGREVPDDAHGWVYLTEDIDVAWAYAWVAPGRGKPKVVEAIPHDDLEPDPEHSPAMRAWRCRWATISRVHTDPTITEDEARDGWDVA